MQIAPIGALEAALSNMSSGLTLQQQVAQGAVAQAGNGSNAADPKSQVLKAKKPEQAEAAMGANQQVAQDAPKTAASSTTRRQTLDPIDATSEHKLFEYLTQVEKSGGQGSDPSALLESAVKSLEGTMQKVQAALEEAGVKTQETGMNGVQDSASSTEGAQAKSPAENAEQLLDRSISVMWAAANLEVVTSSVTAVTSSTSTLIKQQ